MFSLFYKNICKAIDAIAEVVLSLLVLAAVVSPFFLIISDFVDRVSGFILVVLVIIFAYYIWKVARIWFITRVRLGGITKKNDLLKFLAEYECTKYILKEYERTICFKDRNNQEKTSEFASDYFNIGAILTAAKVNVSAMGAAAGILVGIGVLGTFIGLSLGLSDIDLTQVKDNPDSLINGVSTLIAGMKTAFLTSVAGMFLSTVYTLAEKHCINILTKKCVTVSDLLDEKYYISDLEKQDITSERQKEDLVDQVKLIVGEMNKNFSAIDNNGRELTLGNMLLDVKNSCEKQRSMFEGIMEEFYDRLSEGLRENALEPLMDKLDQLTKAIQNPAASMASSVGEDLRKSIMEMIEELKKSVSDATTNKLDALGKQLDNASNILVALPDILNKATEQLQYHMSNISQQMGDIHDQAAKSGENLLDQQAKLNAQSAQIMEDFKKSAEAAKTAVTTVSQIVNDYDRFLDTTVHAAEKLDYASGKVDDSIKDLAKSQDGLVQAYTNSVQETERAFMQIRECIDHSKELSGQYASEFGEIRESLGKVFEDMNDGLNQYSDTVKLGTDQFLTTYTTTVTKIAESLTNSFGELSDTLDKMHGANK